MIHSDRHVHSEFSYDSVTTLETIAENAKAQRPDEKGTGVRPFLFAFILCSF